MKNKLLLSVIIFMIFGTTIVYSITEPVDKLGPQWNVKSQSTIEIPNSKDEFSNAIYNGPDKNYIIRNSTFNNKYGTDWKMEWDNDLNAPKSIIGGSIDLQVPWKEQLHQDSTTATSFAAGHTASPAVLDFIKTNMDVFNIDTSRLDLVKEEYDPPIYMKNSGMWNIVYRQTHEGIPVYGSKVLVSVNNGKLVYLNNKYYPGITIDTIPVISKAQALFEVGKDLDVMVFGAAKEHHKKDKDNISKQQHNGPARAKDVSLVIYPEKIDNHYQYHLAYLVDMETTREPLASWVYVVDATDGRVLDRYDRVISGYIDGYVNGSVYLETSLESPVNVSFWNNTVFAGENASIASMYYSGTGDNLDVNMTTRSSINLTGATIAFLNFSIKYDIEDYYDFAYVSISTDNVTFYELKNYTGFQGSWINESIDISGYAGQEVYLAFSYITDYSIDYDGFYVDNIAITNESGTVFFDNGESGSAQWDMNGFQLINSSIMKISSQSNTNPTGYYNLTNITGNVSLVSNLTGQYVKVINEDRVDSIVDVNLIPSTTYSWNWNDSDSSYLNEESNMFYHVNIIHDYFTNDTSFNISDMNYQMMATVEYGFSSGNAFADGTDIYFYGGDSTYESTALLSDVIYHEYTHNVVAHVYTVPLPYIYESGALNEGWADYFGCTINNNSGVGEGFFKDTPSPLRDLNNSYRYPDDIVKEVHDDSRIISGAMWDLRQALGATITDELIIRAMKLEPQNFQQFLESILIVDDDNGNLNDGTPHIEQIYDAFYNNHGVYSHYLDTYAPGIEIITYESYHEMYPDITDTANITVKNNGNGTLDWSLGLVMVYEMENNSGHWIDGVTNGTNLSLEDDDFAVWELPFNFSFYNETFTKIYVSSNGYLSLVDNSPNNPYNIPIPSTGQDNQYFIAPLWDDWYPPASGGVYCRNLTNPDSVVITWYRIPHFWDFNDRPNTFQAVLYNNNSIEFNYNSINYTNGVTIGLNKGDGVSYNNYSTMPANNTSLIFTKPGIFLENLSHNGTLSKGNEINITLSFNSTGYAPGYYSNVLYIKNNDPYNDSYLLTQNMAILNASDSIKPVISLTSPLNNTTHVAVGFQLNYTVNEDLLDVFYRIDEGPDVTVSGNTNISSTPGHHNVTLLGRDFGDNWNNTSVHVFNLANPEIVLNMSQWNITMNSQPATRDLLVGNNGNYTLDIKTIDKFNVLIIGDGFSETDVYDILSSEGINVTIADVEEDRWDGTNPALDDYKVVILLEGTNFDVDMTPSGQTTLVNFVNNGGGLILGEWITYDIYFNNYYSAIRSLVLLNWSYWDYLEDADTYQVVDTHYITHDIPSTFVTETISHTNGVARDNVTTLITGTTTGDAVAIKEIGKGKVVEYAWANNFLEYWGEPDPWTTEFKQILINSVYWAGSNFTIKSSPDTVEPSVQKYIPITFTPTTVEEGTYQELINIITNDYYNQTVLLPVNITIDNTPPRISFESQTPQHNVLPATNIQNVTINVSLNEIRPDTLIFNWNGVNESYNYTSGYWNITKNVSYGTKYTFFIWVNDTAGNSNQTETRTIPKPSPPKTSGGGGGGGGGGTSGEDFYNILLSENEREYVNKDSKTSYDFDMEGNIITYIRLMGLKSSGMIVSKVEILKNTSALVDSPAPLLIYRNVNIWVGNMGWASPQNIADPVIGFKVDQNWIKENNIDVGTVSLWRYSDDIWNELPTRQTEEDNQFIYFESTTSGFSPFAIRGQKYVTTRVQSTPEKESAQTMLTSETTNTPSKDPRNSGFLSGPDIVMTLAGLLSAAFIVIKRRRP